MKKIYNILMAIFLLILTFLLIMGAIIISVISMNKSLIDYEKKCFRMSIDNETDNCFCPCEPNFIEKTFIKHYDCYGWIVLKNESCLRGVG